jgi:hypothetical protein
MSAQYLAAGLLAALALGCGRQADIDVAEINGRSAKAATEAVFGAITITGDLDDDGAADDADTFLLLIASDSDFVCQDFAIDPELAGDTDIVLVAAFAEKRSINNTRGFAAGHTIQSNDEDIFVETTFLVREAGEEVVAARGEAGRLVIDDLGEEFSGQLVDTLIDELVSGREISAVLSASFQGATRCAAIDALLAQSL